MEGHNSIAADMLRQLVARIERLEAEIKDLNSDKSEVFSEAKANGLDPRILRRVVAIRRQDEAKRREDEAVLDLYLEALGMSA